jgi:DNA-binding transcriptional MerR regulator
MRMKVSELARRAGVSKETIHFYLREGLLHRPRKAGRNMAFYDEAHLERLRLIKRLQKERYLPLEVIRRVLAGGAGLAAGPEMELLGEVLALGRGSAAPPAAEAPAVTRAALAKRAGVRRDLIDGLVDALVAEGAIGAPGAALAAGDALVVELAASLAGAAGFDAPATARIFTHYQRSLAAMASGEAELYGQAILATGRPLEAVEGVRRAREAVNRFLIAEHARLVQRQVERMLGQIVSALQPWIDPPLFAPSPSLAARGADERAVEPEAPDAVRGAALLRRARHALAEAGGAGAMALAQEALGALTRSAAGEPGLYAALVRGRTWVALPQLFGVHERGRAELERVAAAGEAPGASATAVWMAANACYFLGRFARAAELDGDGPLAARARERAKENGS